jgi:hypothetical protein
MRATSSPSTATDASLTRCTSARTRTYSDSMPHPAHPAEPAASGPAAVDVVDEYLHGLPGGVRRVAHAEWGLTIAAETLGEPLDLGVSISDGSLRVKAPALGAGHEVDPWLLLSAGG